MGKAVITSYMFHVGHTSTYYLAMCVSHHLARIVKLTSLRRLSFSSPHADEQQKGAGRPIRAGDRSFGLWLLRCTPTVVAPHLSHHAGVARTAAAVATKLLIPLHRTHECCPEASVSIQPARQVDAVAGERRPTCVVQLLALWAEVFCTCFRSRRPARSGDRHPTCTTSFTDVGNSSIFYSDILFLACRSAISGFPNGDGSFRFEPNSNTTRGQFAKIAVLGFGLASYTPTTPTFGDVVASSVFYPYVEAAYRVGAITGLSAAQCAVLGLVAPCYGPNVAISRVEAAVIVQRISNYPPFVPAGPSFSDVPAAAFGYAAVEALANRSIIAGAACGSSRCFRPNAAIRRGELSKVVRRAISVLP